MGSNKISTIDLEEPVVSALNTIDTVADQITSLTTDTSDIKAVVDGNSTKLNTIGAAVDETKAAVNTVNTNVDSVKTDVAGVKSDVAENKTNISTVNTNVAANKAILENSTYGLSKIKTAIDTVDGIVDTINTNVSANKTTLGTVSTNVSSIKTTVETANSNISTIAGNVNTINTNCSNLNSRLTSTRAGYLDYLANSTYGLSAIKTAINNLASNSGGIKSIQHCSLSVSKVYDASYTISAVTLSKSFIVNRGLKVTDMGSTSTTAYPRIFMYSLSLTDSTTVRYHNPQISAFDGVVEFDVIEFQ